MSETHNISWIKSVITLKYSNFLEQGGADLDGNGTIEGNERFGDLNKNGKTGDQEDFWLYLERNKGILSREIEFIGWGQNLRSDNIINEILYAELRVSSKQDIEKAFKRAVGLIEMVRAGSGRFSKMPPKYNLMTAQEMLINKGHIKFTPRYNPLFSEDLLASKLDCDTGSFLLLAIGQELSWPLYMVNAPGHAFIRWQDFSFRFNFDVNSKGGDPAIPDRFYIESDNISDTALKNGVYLRTLPEEQIMARVYNNIALKRFMSGDFKRAIDEFNECIDIDPLFIEGYLDMASVKIGLSDFDGAIALFKKALQLDPNCATAYWDRSQIWISRSDFQSALSDLDRYISFRPNDAHAYSRRGMVKAALQNKDLLPGSLADHDMAIKLDPKVAEYYLYRGLTLGEMGYLDRAKADLDESLSRDKKQAHAYLNRAVVRGKLGDLRGAEKDCTKGLELEPDNFQLYLTRAKIRTLLGDHFGAQEDMIKYRAIGNKRTITVEYRIAH